jgi:hypothetical protein
MRKLIAASIIALVAAPVAASAETIEVGCEHGEITLDRLADGNCLARIPVPTERPEKLETAAATPAPSKTSRNFRYIETPDPETGKARTVRIVGPVYLPDDNDAISLQHNASIASDPLNAVFNGFASLFGVGSAYADEPEKRAAVTLETDHSVKERLEARADIRILAAHMN